MDGLSHTSNNWSERYPMAQIYENMHQIWNSLPEMIIPLYQSCKWETCYFSSFTSETSFFFFFFRHILVISFFLQFFGVILWKISWNCQESATFNNINSERERKARGDCGGQKCWLLPMAMLVSSCDSSQIDNTPLDPPGAESLWFWVQLKGVARRRRA